MLELLLIRHGRTDWNDSRIVMGHKPVPLNDVGISQAEELADYLAGAGLRAIISSPIRRAARTAEIIAKRQDGIVVELDEGLAEIDYGEWVGKSFFELEENNSEIWRAYHESPQDVQLPGGETMRDVADRVARTLDRVRASFDDGRVAIVSHADVLKLAIVNLLKLDIAKIRKFTVDNCAIMLVRFYPEVGPRLVAYNVGSVFEKDV